MAIFPRKNDYLGHAWGLTGSEPVEVWERLSPAYEAQAEALWNAFAARGLNPSLEWAGSQDGEAIIGRDDDDEIVILYHLESPAEARTLALARAEGSLNRLIATHLRELEQEAQRYA